MAYSHRIAKVVTVIAFCVSYVIEGDPNTRLVYEICNGETYGEGTSFYRTLQEVLYQVRENTAYNKYNYYYHSPWPGPSPTCYGYGRCNGQIWYSDCTACLRVAADQILRDCPMRVGAQLQLVDCRIRYEKYQFWES